MGANGIDSVTSNEEVDTQGWQRVLIKALQNLNGEPQYALAA
jgi:hypothetical protein